MYTKEELQEQGFANRNAISWRFYLWLENQLSLKAEWFGTPERLTFYQAKQSWLKIKKGSKGVTVIYENLVPIWEIIDGEVITEPIYYKRAHKVFNIEQTEQLLNSN